MHLVHTDSDAFAWAIPGPAVTPDSHLLAPGSHPGSAADLHLGNTDLHLVYTDPTVGIRTFAWAIPGAAVTWVTADLHLFIS